MARTRFYQDNSYTPQVTPSAWHSTFAGGSASPRTGGLMLVRESSGNPLSATYTVAGATDADYYLARYVSKTIAVNKTVATSEGIQVCIYTYESSTSANLATTTALRCIKPDGSERWAWVWKDHSLEWGTTTLATGDNSGVDTTPQETTGTDAGTFFAGDRVVIEWGFDKDSTASYTGTAYFGGSSATAVVDADNVSTNRHTWVDIPGSWTSADFTDSKFATQFVPTLSFSAILGAVKSGGPIPQALNATLTLTTVSLSKIASLYRTLSATLALSTAALVKQAERILAATLGLSIVQSTTPAYVNSNFSYSGDVQTDVTLTGVTNGNLLVAIPNAAYAEDMSIATQSGSTSGWTEVVHQDRDGAGPTIEMWWARATASGSVTVRATNQSDGALMLLEYSGVVASGAPVDVYQVGGGGSGTAWQTVALSAAANTILVFGSTQHVAPLNVTPYADYIERIDDSNATQQAVDRQITSAGSYTPGVTAATNSWPWCAAAVTFKGAGADGLFKVLAFVRSLPATLTLSASLAKTVAFLRILASTLSFSAILDAVKSGGGPIPQALNATLTLTTATLSRAMTLYRSLTATLALTSVSLATQRAFARSLTATLTLTTAVLNRVQARVLAATLALLPVLSRAMTLYRSLAATLALSTVTLDRVKVKLQSMAATLALTTISLVKQVSFKRTLAAVISLSAVLDRALTATRVMATSMSLSPVLNKTALLYRLLTATLTLIAALTRIKVVLKSMAATVTLSPVSLACRLSLNRTITAALTLSAVLSRAISVTIAATLNLLVELTSLMPKYLPRTTAIVVSGWRQVANIVNTKHTRVVNTKGSTRLDLEEEHDGE